jgi:hypothetical protein
VRGSPDWSHESTEKSLLVNFYEIVCEILGFTTIDEVKADVSDRSFTIVMETIHELKKQALLQNEEKSVSLEEVLALELFNGEWMNSYDIEAIHSDYTKLFCG